ncbi:hypothetical protein PG994_010480 [Apiospora phragmitis]|uniref:Uncharacterized protein n=1 Tax=Apiospora phragmitis TaxID=2905665 RepID=A0ABR1TQ12_9PEZI
MLSAYVVVNAYHTIYGTSDCIYCIQYAAVLARRTLEYSTTSQKLRSGRKEIRPSRWAAASPPVRPIPDRRSRIYFPVLLVKFC